MSTDDSKVTEPASTKPGPALEQEEERNTEAVPSTSLSIPTTNRTVIDTRKVISGVGDNRKRSFNQMTSYGPPHHMPHQEQQQYHQQGGWHRNVHKGYGNFTKKPRFDHENTKLEIKKIPRDLNTITKLNEHFSKFGTIVNLQVRY